MEYYSAIEKKEILAFVTTCLDLDGIILSKISQTGRDKYHLISLICGIQKQNKQNRNQRIDTKNEETVEGWEGVQG